MKINDFCQYFKDSDPKNVSKQQQNDMKNSEKSENCRFFENYRKSKIVMAFYDATRHSLAVRKCIK